MRKAVFYMQNKGADQLCKAGKGGGGYKNIKIVKPQAIFLIALLLSSRV